MTEVAENKKTCIVMIQVLVRSTGLKATKLPWRSGYALGEGTAKLQAIYAYNPLRHKKIEMQKNLHLYFGAVNRT